MRFLATLLANWRVILVGLVLGATFYYFNALRSERDHAIADLKEYVRLQTELSAKQEHLNQIKLIQAKNEVNVAKLVAKQQIEQFGLDREKLANEMRKLYETKINTLKRNLANSVRVLPSGDSASKTAEASSDPKGLAGSESDCHPALARLQEGYDTLEKACILTTIDFNECRAWMDTSCSIAACE